MKEKPPDSTDSPFDYLYPSRNQCMQCHQAGTGPVLGFRTRQLNRSLAYPGGVTANQIESFSAAGFIPRNLKAADLASVITSGDIRDPDLSDEKYVRSYLDSNCSHCHQPDGSSRAFFDARFTTPLTNQSLVCGPVIDGLGLSAPAVIKPGSLDNSVLFQRISAHNSPIVMPPIARGPVDYASVARVANWILSMNADSCTKSQSFFGGGDLGITGAPGGSTGGEVWKSNMVIQKNATYTHTGSSPVTVLLDRFSFHANLAGDPVTPFFVRVNAPDDFTVVAIGTTRSGYSSGANDLAFSDAPLSITLQPGESIAPGFLDANPNGSGGSGAEVIAWTDGGTAVWHGGGLLDSNAGSLTLGSAPVPGTNLITHHARDYHFAFTYIVSALQMGNNLDQAGYKQPDGGKSNFVINQAEAFTNQGTGTLTVSVDRFRFHASQVTDPLTPFVVRINGPGDFTVLAIGDARPVYSVGNNDVPFSGAPATIVVAPGETIAPGFVDNLPDGSPGTQAGAVSFIHGGDSIFYRYDSEDRGAILELGQAPVVPFRYPAPYLPGALFQRDYLFSITLGFGGKDDEDGDGLKDSWELAFAPGLNQLSATLDSDNDGMNDLAEYQAGTSPTDRTSVMKTLNLTPGPAGASALIQTVPGRDYQVRASSDLGSWKDVGIFKAADWPATETSVLIPAADLPAGAERRLFIQIGPSSP